MDSTVYSESMQKLIGELSRLPGIGSKMAARLALHVLKMPDEKVAEFAICITGT